MIRAVVVAMLAVGASELIAIPASHASPPPPPPTPVCRYCQGPPPAPTPVPTLGATVVAAQSHSVAVSLSPAHVRRGQQTTVTVTASARDRVTMLVRYSHGRRVTFRAQVGSAGKVVKRWRVPQTIATGRATVRIDVVGEGKPYSVIVAFTVLK